MPPRSAPDASDLPTAALPAAAASGAASDSPSPPVAMPDPDCIPLVRTRGNRLTLEFQPGDIQSEMLLSDPDALVLEYARAMMCFALFVPRPRHILMVGLGGGSLVKFCHRHFPDARITVVEISSEVIALRERFRVPPDDARLRIVHADAAAYLAGAGAIADVILVDGFDSAGMPPALGSECFYADCRRALREGGVLVANLLSYDPGRAQLAERLGTVFGGRVCDFRGIAGNNHLLFAVRGARSAASAGALRTLKRVARLRGLGLPLLNRLLARAVVAWLAWRPV